MTLDDLIALRDGAHERAQEVVGSAAPLDIDFVRSATVERDGFEASVYPTGLIRVQKGNLDLRNKVVSTGSVDVSGGAVVTLGNTWFQGVKLDLFNGGGAVCRGTTLFTQNPEVGSKPGSLEVNGTAKDRYLSDLIFADLRIDAVKAKGVLHLDRCFFESTMPPASGNAHGDGIQNTRPADLRVTNSVFDLRKDHRIFQPGVDRGAYNAAIFVHLGKAQIEDVAVWQDPDANALPVKVGVRQGEATASADVVRLHYSAKRALGGHPGLRIAEITRIDDGADVTQQHIDSGARLWRWAPGPQNTPEIARLQAELQAKQATIQSAVDGLRAALL